MNANKVMCPGLMKEFVENFSFVKAVVKSVVVGVEIKFYYEYMRNLFECPFEGYNTYFKGKVEVPVKGGIDEVLGFKGGTTGVTLTSHKCSLISFVKGLCLILKK